MFKSLSRNQTTILIVLSLINFLNYVDRQVVFPLFDLIKQDFHVNDFQLGLLGTAFMLVHSLSTLPLGILADKIDRKKIIAVGIFFWSIMTFLSGLAQTFKQLLGVRSLVGIGESSYAPPATAMISDNIPEEFRARAQGVFNIGMFMGGTIGAMAGGVIAYYFHSWRLAFFAVSVPGILLALWSLRLVDVRAKKTSDEPLNLKALISDPPYVWTIVSGILATFAATAFVAWGIEFIVRYKGYNLRDTSLILGGTLMVAGVLGVFLGSWVADHLQKRFAWGRSITVGISLMLAAPVMFAGLADTAQGTSFFVYFFFGTLLLSVYHGPAVAVLHDVVPSHIRASAFAFYVLFLHLIGSTFAPAIVGAISDKWNLRIGMELCTIPVFLGGLTFMVVSWYLRKNHLRLQEDTEPVLDIG